MSDADGTRFVPALRRVWEGLRAEVGGKLGQPAISGEELRAYVAREIASREENSRSVRGWNALPPGGRDAALRAAFPDDSYALTPPAGGGGS